ncbi:MAG: cob(I)yrinic acid a,c-diamide adenosyltransferase [Oscillospiraceae bacterium]
MKGLIHIYTGNGKGKTTASIGLAVRAAGCGRKVVFVQFFKGRDCGELHSFEKLPNITVLRQSSSHGFFKNMSDDEKEIVRKEHNKLLYTALDFVKNGECELLVLDEVISAYTHEMLDRAAVDALLLSKPEELELVLTGRNAPESFVESADYVTEMKKIKHPFDKGIPARKGVEF